MYETDEAFAYSMPSCDVIDTDVEYLSQSDCDVLEDLIAQAGATINPEDYYA